MILLGNLIRSRGRAVSVEQVKCVECDNMILPQTAAANGGLCAPCAKMSVEQRIARREHESKLASGAWFTPSAEERLTAKQPAEFSDPAAVWSPEPNIYKATAIRLGQEAIDVAEGEPRGYVFLVSDRGGLLSLAFNDAFGVCQYQNSQSGDNRYAYTPENLADQVSADRQLSRACSCCGVEMDWYPSRFHMPRQIAFAILAAVALGRSSSEEAAVEWLTCGDISDTEHGRG
jgi:hypothetical protein